MTAGSARKVRAWLVENGIKQASIAEELGVNRSTVSRWIAGHIQSQRIYGYFLGIGCPERYFSSRPEARRAA